jgi:hypothetical protein
MSRQSGYWLTWENSVKDALQEGMKVHIIVPDKGAAKTCRDRLVRDGVNVEYVSFFVNGEKAEL